MKLLVAITLLLTASLASAQPAPTVANLRYNSPAIAFDGTEANTAQEQNTLFETRLYQNGQGPRIVTSVCTGTAKPWVCTVDETNLEIGNNIYYVTIKRKPPCTNLPGSTQCDESGFSNPLVVFHAVNQREVITNTQIQTTIRCAPGSYRVQRITNATILEQAANSVTTVISNILATSNAIYIFSCTPVSQNP